MLNVHCIRQVASLLGYQEPQVLKSSQIPFLPDYTGFFSPLTDLQLAVETVKRDSNKGENRQTISWTVILHSTYEHMIGS